MSQEQLQAVSQQEDSMKNRIFPPIPVRMLCLMAWVYLISALSSQPAEESADLSQGICFLIARILCSQDWLADMLVWLGLPVSADACALGLSWTVRKAAHVTEYCVLGVLLAWTLLPLYSLRQTVQWTLGLGIVLATLDEVHQHFVPGRSCQVQDVLIDTGGLILGISCFVLVRYVRRARRQTGNRRTGERGEQHREQLR